MEVFRRTLRRPVPRDAAPETKRGIKGVTYTVKKRRRWSPLAPNGRWILVEHPIWAVRYTRHGRRVTMSTGTRDLAAARAIAAKMEVDYALERRGVIDEASSRAAAAAPDPKTLQSLARHADPQVTLNVYAKVRETRQRQAIAAMPPMPPTPTPAPA